MPLSLKNKTTRLRKNPLLRSLVRETELNIDDLIMPIFFKDGKGTEAVPSMPGINKFSSECLLREAEALGKSGIKSILLFGSSPKKDSSGSSSYNEESQFHKAIKNIKKSSDLIIIADVCLCAFTDHGHCGIAKKTSGKNGAHLQIDDSKTAETLAKIAVSYAKAGADMVAPSAMANGQVKAIRETLDKNGFTDTSIISYSAKYASNFYGPFRGIYDSTPKGSDRKGYQMDFGNKREAIREIFLDIEEGADIVMVKPALSYLDIIQSIRDKVNIPIAAYNVSGEYSMVKAAHLKGWLDEKSVALEILQSIKRAGADIIISYWAKEATKWI
ncbi:MAG: porphobilinogen synthase [Candidatus Omnitrophica bacterium]|nr:porphobilinogen synthase [Candidatus Omnitrophota bacterium]